MAMFNSYVSHYQRVNPIKTPLNHHFPMVFLHKCQAIHKQPLRHPSARASTRQRVQRAAKSRRARRGGEGLEWRGNIELVMTNSSLLKMDENGLTKMGRCGNPSLTIIWSWFSLEGDRSGGTSGRSGTRRAAPTLQVETPKEEVKAKTVPDPVLCCYSLLHLYVAILCWCMLLQF